MSFKLKIFNKRAIATFTNKVEETGITSAFLEIIDAISVEKLNFIIFDCTSVTDYTIPADYMTRVKVVTHFSTRWNSNISIIFIATNSEIQHMATAFINHSEDLKWKYLLFEDLKEALDWCNKNDQLH